MGIVTVFACTKCGAPVTQRVERLEEVLPVPEELLGNSGDDWIPVGAYLDDVGSAAAYAEFEGGPIVNVADMVGVKRHPERWFDGCCGALGWSGPNLLCTNDHEVATEVADCHSLNGVWLLADATKAVATDE